MMIPVYAYLQVGLIGAIAFDFFLGDPPNRYHLVSWLGRLIAFLIKRSKGDKNGFSVRRERLAGFILATSLVGVIGIGTQCLIFVAFHMFGIIAIIIMSVLLLKIALAIKGMEKHTYKILKALERDDLKSAQNNLSLIVRRDTGELSQRYVISATIECIGESTVDGIVGPLFFYSLLGPAGAIIYRVVNTLDSMVGYNDNYYRNIGWASAKLDTFFNYVPARITSILMIISAQMLGEDWKNSVQILRRDRNKTSSHNAGYPMATMAGALRIKLEKAGHYTLGDSLEPLSIRKCQSAISIMKITVVLFSLSVCFPLLLILYLLGWWRFLFGI
ncbi:MAG TPA: cobalamin biosynthesis protein [Candidatus Nitrosopolaris sp.]|nr:cobalamin biosynthesis protein [Candidatus Nitrosopolaris sp.]